MVPCRTLSIVLGLLSFAAVTDGATASLSDFGTTAVSGKASVFRAGAPGTIEWIQCKDFTLLGDEKCVPIRRVQLSERFYHAAFERFILELAHGDVAPFTPEEIATYRDGSAYEAEKRRAYLTDLAGRIQAEMATSEAQSNFWKKFHPDEKEAKDKIAEARSAHRSLGPRLSEIERELAGLDAAEKSLAPFYRKSQDLWATLRSAIVNSAKLSLSGSRSESLSGVDRSVSPLGRSFLRDVSDRFLRESWSATTKASVDTLAGWRGYFRSNGSPAFTAVDGAGNLCHYDPYRMTALQCFGEMQNWSALPDVRALKRITGLTLSPNHRFRLHSEDGTSVTFGAMDYEENEKTLDVSWESIRGDRPLVMGVPFVDSAIVYLKGSAGKFEIRSVNASEPSVRLAELPSYPREFRTPSVAGMQRPIACWFEAAGRLECFDPAPDSNSPIVSGPQSPFLQISGALHLAIGVVGDSVPVLCVGSSSRIKCDVGDNQDPGTYRLDVSADASRGLLIDFPGGSSDLRRARVCAVGTKGIACFGLGGHGRIALPANLDRIQGEVRSILSNHQLLCAIGKDSIECDGTESGLGARSYRLKE